MTERATTSRGISLAKGPIAILGLIGIIYGLSGLIFASHGFAVHFPHGAVTGKHWIGLLVNGWSELLFIAAGLALVLFAPAHWSAKTMAMIVGLVLIAAAIIAAIRGNGVFGIFAANKATEVVWAAAGVLLLILSFLPRVGRRTTYDREVARDDTVAGDGTVARDDSAAPAGATRREPVPVRARAGDDDRTTADDPRVADDAPVTDTRDTDDASPQTTTTSRTDSTLGR